MTTPHRDIVNALYTAITTAVPSLASATAYKEEPVRHDPNGTHFAIWFEGITRDEKNDTTLSQSFRDLYAVRYWEPAPTKARMVVDETAASSIETLMDAAVVAVMDNQLGIGTSYDTRFEAASKFIGQDTGPKGGQVAGFEMAVSARRYRDLT